jgi:hypothetical protein
MSTAFKKITYFSQNGNTLGTVKDMTNGLVSNGITITKDKIPWVHQNQVLERDTDT